MSQFIEEYSMIPAENRKEYHQTLINIERKSIEKSFEIKLFKVENIKLRYFFMGLFLAFSISCMNENKKFLDELYNKKMEGLNDRND